MYATSFRPNRFLGAALLTGAYVAIATGPAFAQDTNDTGDRNWSNSTQLSWVLSKGNSNNSSFAVRNVYRYMWERAEFYWEVGVLRASSRRNKFAVGTQDDFEVVTPETDLAHNRAFSKFRYLRALNDLFFWYVNYDSSRDPPANINVQLIGSGGVGNDWYDREGLTFRTSYGLNYTHEALDLEGSRLFPGYRLFYHLEVGASESTALESELTFDGSFQTADDLRFDSLNSVSVTMTDKLALKGSLRLLFRNLPALDDIDLVDPDSGAVVGTVVVRKEKLDTTVSMSLVLNF